MRRARAVSRWTAARLSMRPIALVNLFACAMPEVSLFRLCQESSVASSALRRAAAVLAFGFFVAVGRFVAGAGRLAGLPDLMPTCRALGPCFATMGFGPADV